MKISEDLSLSQTKESNLIEPNLLNTLRTDDQDLSKADLSTRLNRSRRALEQFILRLGEIWDFSVPKKAGPDEIVAHIRKRQIELKGKEDSKLVFEHFRTIGRYGNVGSHYQDTEMDDLELYRHSVEICKLAWEGLIKWSSQIVNSIDREIPRSSIENRLSLIKDVTSLAVYNTHLNRKIIHLGKSAKKVYRFFFQVDPTFNFNRGDRNFPYWEPCSIANIKCPYSQVNRERKLITWRGIHRYLDRGIRLSYLNPSTNRYRHILLVEEDNGEDIFKPLSAQDHSIAVINNYLLLSYHEGTDLRIFDLHHLYKSAENKAKDRIGRGKVLNENLYAFNYRYISPQIISQTLDRSIICLGESFNRTTQEAYAITRTTDDHYQLELVELNDTYPYFNFMAVKTLSPNFEWSNIKGFSVRDNKQTKELFILLNNTIYRYDLENSGECHGVYVSSHLNGLSYSHQKKEFHSIISKRYFRTIASISNDMIESLGKAKY